MYILCMVANLNIPNPILAAERARELGITQEEIALAVNASQSQVSRILSGRSKRKTALAEKICIYVNSRHGNTNRQMVEKNETLMEALAQTWDGSTRQAEILAIMIRAAGSLASSRSKSG
jgi:transcriptional regulator with XRE-family HTH domain